MTRASGGGDDKLVSARWPGGQVPKDPARALRELKPPSRTFLGNVSGAAEWITDGHMIFRADLPGGDRKLVERLRLRAPKTPREPYGARAVAHVAKPWQGPGHWPVEPCAIFLGSELKGRTNDVTVRYRVPGGPSVLDANADIVRTVDLCVGGWDAVTWEGFGPLSGYVLRFWRGGETVGAIAGLTGAGVQLCPSVAAEAVLSGADVRPPGFLCPEWEDDNTVLNDIPKDLDDGAHLDATAERLGGERERWGTFSWRVPTRVGTARIGMVDGRTLLFFEDLLRLRGATRKREYVEDDAGLMVLGHPTALRYVFIQGLSVAPKYREKLRAPPTPGPYAARFSVTRDEKWTRVFDATKGEMAPGVFADATRAHSLVERLVAARNMAASAGAGK